MSFATLRDKIKAELEAVSGIGVVHNRQRWTIDQDRLKALFGKVETVNGEEITRINGWTITRAATPEQRVTGGESTRQYLFIIRGYFSMTDHDTAADASEQIFQELIEAICARFRAKPDLDDLADSCEPPQVAAVDYRLFAGILCHYCELQLEVWEQVIV